MYLPVQVTLSLEETNVPVGQLVTHFPCERKNPGKQPVHCCWPIVDATVKFGIPQEVHFGAQAGFRMLVRKPIPLKGKTLYAQSHTCLTLLATKLDPVQTPFPSVVTQTPLSNVLPVAQIAQSLEVPPVHVWHSGEQGVHFPPLRKAPSGQVAPVESTCGAGWHLLPDRVRPDLQVIQTPLESAHWVQPAIHAI
jgi:hypothetical protein